MYTVIYREVMSSQWELFIGCGVVCVHKKIKHFLLASNLTNCIENGCS
jgi:hypothetical protein